MSFNLRTGVGKEFNLRTGLSGFQDITAEEISTGIIGAERLPEITKSKVSNAGQWEPSEIPALSSDTITSGTLDPARIPDFVHALESWVTSLLCTDRSRNAETRANCRYSSFRFSTCSRGVVGHQVNYWHRTGK